ncbi:MAG TPA: MEDS domain-containing protein [Candidatus Acidoferrales bacterium]|nr:MEDS domain-containing protein [Candidatus Acidoferrales bacterium]
MSAKTASFEPWFLAPEINWREHDCDGHGVQLYTEDSFLLGEMGGFIGRTLESGGAAIVIATESHRQGLEKQLQSRGMDTAIATEKGRLVTLDAAETLSKLMVEGYPDAGCFTEVVGDAISRAKSAAVNEDSRVAAFGEMVALLWAEGKPDAAIHLEQLWIDLARTHRFSLRCAYPMNVFRHEDADGFLKMCAQHSDVIPADGYSRLLTNEDRLRNIAALQQTEQAYLTLQAAQKELERQIAEKMETQEKLEASERSLRNLSGRLLRMQDEERRHIGRELHDTIGQYLAALKMGLDLMKPEIEGKPGMESNGNRAAEQLGVCIHLADESITEVRTMSYLLYPPMLEEMGLKTAVPWYLEGFSKRSGIRATFEIPDTFPRLPRDLELSIFRVIQESLTNVLRHSASATVHIRMAIQNGTVFAEVKDMGKGIPLAILQFAHDAPDAPGIGLHGMSERMRQFGGNLELLSSEEGTTVTATAPCEEAVSTGTSRPSSHCHDAADSAISPRLALLHRPEVGNAR